MYNSTIRQKVGICPSCPSSSKPTPLIKGFCNSHYWQSIRVKSAEKKSLMEVPSETILKPKIATSRKSSTSGGAALNRWFLDRREELTGTCQCGCGNKSQKNDDMFFRHSICHIFPKSKFPSVKIHPLNFVERAFWGGCHSILDDTSIDRWVNMADWDDIKAKFHIISESISEQEKTIKFYNKLHTLVYGNI